MLTGHALDNEDYETIFQYKKIVQYTITRPTHLRSKIILRHYIMI